MGANFYITGGGGFNSECADKLLSAEQEGRIDLGNIHIIEEPRSSKWVDHLSRYLLENAANSYLVPSHNGPHILGQLFHHLMSLEFKDIVIRPLDIEFNLGVPFVRRLQGGQFAFSYADWVCPLDCVEGESCPATGSERRWDLGNAIKAECSNRFDFLGVFHCRHEVFPVGTLPLEIVLSEWHRLKKLVVSKGRQRIAVATHSYCHGLISAFDVSIG